MFLRLVIGIRILLLNGSLWCLNQCSGSGSALIWAVLDLEPYWESNPDPGAWKLKKIYKKTGFLAFKKALVPSKVFFWPITYFNYIFLCKNSTCCDLKAVLRIRIQDPGSGAFLTPGSGMGKKSGSGSGMNIPDHISESLETIFWVNK